MRIWQDIWAVWLTLVLASFLILESIAAIENVQNTLTDTSRTWLHVIVGQTPNHWTLPHLIAAIVMFLFMTWLFGHIILGIWG